jgi:hypothetical protein
LNRNLNQSNDELNESFNTGFTTNPFVSSQVFLFIVFNHKIRAKLKNIHFNE